MPRSSPRADAARTQPRRTGRGRGRRPRIVVRAALRRREPSSLCSAASGCRRPRFQARWRPPRGAHPRHSLRRRCRSPARAACGEPFADEERSSANASRRQLDPDRRACSPLAVDPQRAARARERDRQAGETRPGPGSTPPRPLSSTMTTDRSPSNRRRLRPIARACFAALASASETTKYAALSTGRR